MKLFLELSIRLNLIFFIFNGMIAGIALGQGLYKPFAFHAAISLLNGLAYSHFKRVKELNEP